MISIKENRLAVVCDHCGQEQFIKTRVQQLDTGDDYYRYIFLGHKVCDCGVDLNVKVITTESPIGNKKHHNEDTNRCEIVGGDYFTITDEKNKDEKSETMISDYLDSVDIPLEITIKVSVEMAFINLIHQLGYREEKVWSESEDELLGKIIRLANIQSDRIMELIKQDKDERK